VRKTKALAIAMTRHDAVLGIERRLLDPEVEVLEVPSYGFGALSD
jgi:hypothetical protein